MLSKEFRAVESKANLLGQAYRGAREDVASIARHNRRPAVERMALALTWPRAWPPSAA